MALQQNSKSSENESEKIHYFPRSTFIGLFSVFIIVVTMGILAYSQLSKIVKTAQQTSKGDSRQLMLREITSELYDAENLAINYTLTDDKIFLEGYYSARNKLQTKLDEFQNLPTEDNRSRLLAQDLESLIHEKLVAIQSQLELQDGNRTDEVLAQLSRNLQRSFKAQEKQAQAKITSKPAKNSATKKPSEKEKAERSKAIFQWMLGVKPDEVQKKNSDSANIQIDSNREDTIFASQKESLPASIEKELESLRRAESNAYRKQLQRVLDLRKKDQEISAEIREVVDKIDVLERQRLAKKAFEVSKIAKSANNWVVVFCVVLTLFVLILTFGIVAYFRTTKKHQESIESAKLQAELLAEARANFLATMSHEIRTPMNAIIGFTDQLQKTDLSSAQNSQLKIVQGAAQHLLGVVNGVLDFSRLRQNQMPFESKPFNIADEIEIVRAMVQTMANEKGINLEVQISDKVPAWVLGDGLRFRQILLNLIGNAVKFTSFGKIEIIANQTEEKIIGFEVRDTGIGIPHDRIDAIFQPFEQSDSSISQQYGGSGLGLAITQMLVQQQGGEIWLESELGKGTSVFFKLPLSAGQAIESPPQTQIDLSILVGKKVLIADDEHFNRRLLLEILQAHQAICIEAENGKIALQLAQERQFDILLLDIKMPEMDGLHALKQIRSASKSMTASAIILSAASPFSSKEDYEAAGCQAFLSKPFEEAELLEKMCHLLKGNTIQPIASIDYTNTEFIFQKPIFSLESLKKSARGNTAFVEEMVLSFIQTAEKGLQAISLSFQQEDLASLGDHCHKLAAPSKHLGATEVYQTLKAIEIACEDEKEKTGIVSKIDLLSRQLNALLPAMAAELESEKDQI